jgi:hypothetical protein
MPLRQVIKQPNLELTSSLIRSQYQYNLLVDYNRAEHIVKKTGEKRDTKLLSILSI